MRLVASDLSDTHFVRSLYIGNTESSNTNRVELPTQERNTTKVVDAPYNLGNQSSTTKVTISRYFVANSLRACLG
jgi:hypothetical protein